MDVMLASLLLASTVLGFGAASPAAATDVCVGTGNAVIGTPGLLAPMMPPVNAASGTHLYVLLLQDSFETLPFVLSITTGACTPDLSTLAGNGAVNGYCGHSGGAGTDNDGHDFGWVSVGEILVITGGLTGVIQVRPDVTIANNSCFTGFPNREGALTFIVAGAAARTNCAGGWTLIPFLTLITFPVPVTGLPIFSQSILSFLINVHSDGVVAVHMHGSVHWCTNPTKL